MSAGTVPSESALHRQAGWVAGAIVVVVVLAAGAALWFMHHP